VVVKKIKLNIENKVLGTVSDTLSTLIKVPLHRLTEFRSYNNNYDKLLAVRE
jgi:hypothetical protein